MGEDKNPFAAEEINLDFSHEKEKEIRNIPWKHE